MTRRMMNTLDELECTLAEEKAYIKRLPPGSKAYQVAEAKIAELRRRIESLTFKMCLS